MPPLPPPQPPKRPRRVLVGAGVAVAALVAAVVVFLVTRDGGSDPAPAAPVVTGPVTTVVGGVKPAMTQPVEVSGDPLPDLPRAGKRDAAVRLLAPTLSGYSFDGAPVTVEAGGAPTMIVFLAHWDEQSRQEVPEIVAWARDAELPEGLDIVAVSTEVDAGRSNYPPADWLAGEGWEWPVLADSADDRAATAYGVSNLPYIVIVDADMRVLVRFSGTIEPDRLDALVRATLAAS